MAPDRAIARAARTLVLAMAATLALSLPAHALRLVNYNITNYPGNNSATRDPHFRTVLSTLAADVVVVQEMQSQAGVNQFLGNLNAIEPGQWSAAAFYNGNDTDNALFYKPAAVEVLGSWAWYPNPGNLLRYVTCWRLRPVGYTRAELRVYSQHLKASSGSANEAQRLAEAIGIRDSMNNVPPGTQSILTGDFNIYRSSEAAFQKLLEVQADNDGRLYDPLNAVGTWNAANFAAIHTQCPCLDCPPGSGFSGGGLDDRFDMFLPTYTLNDNQGIDLIPGTYVPVGNDGWHYNLNITDPPTIPEGAGYATALWNSSDHLPVRVDLRLPPKVSAPAALALGTSIGGNSLPLPVANAATDPAFPLTYSLAAPAGFSAPGGSFQLAPGAPANQHTIATSGGALGPRAGNLTVTSNDADAPAQAVSLTATLVDHAVPTFDPDSADTAAVADFGSHGASGFTTRSVLIRNLGYSPTRARLAIAGATIAGGAGRFSLVGGFHPALVGATPEEYTLAFDDAGATQDSSYQALLTFQTADEPIPGATALPDLTVRLVATLWSGVLGAGPGGLPARTRLLAPFPNPFSGSGTLRFELAEAGAARLEVFDLSGRRVAVVASGSFTAGRHAFDWNGRADDGSALGAGLYFVRLIAPGGLHATRIAIAR
jgi:endonuclease/exonuclease/phosphatase family metal-dependent hydrolase